MQGTQHFRDHDFLSKLITFDMRVAGCFDPYALLVLFASSIRVERYHFKIPKLSLQL